MKTDRLEAFSDGVIAIIITIMVLELKVPHSPDLHEAALIDLRPLIPVFISYLLSFIYIGIYWNNHHHLLHTAEEVNGPILWANSHLLFWLSLVPFVTAWMGENHFSSVPVALYGFVLLMAAIAYSILTVMLLRQHGKDSRLARAIGNDFKGKISIVIYLASLPLACVNAWIAFSLYIVVAIMWFVPDTRIEKEVNSQNDYVDTT